MSSNPEATQSDESGNFSLTKLPLLSLLTGAGIGLVIGCFRVALEHMETARTDTVAWALQRPVLGFVLICATVVATTAFAVWLVQRSGQLLHASPKAPAVGALASTSMSASPWERGVNRPDGRSPSMVLVSFYLAKQIFNSAALATQPGNN